MPLNETSVERSRDRRILIRAGLLLATIVLVVEIRAAVGSMVSMQDFVQYWAATRLNLRGSNPYDATAMLAMERPLGWTEPEPNLMFNPPWMLSLAAPSAFLDYVTARSVCLFLQLAIIVGVAFVLWDDHGGPSRLLWVAMLLAMTSYSSLMMFRLGQSSVIVLLGLVGFIHWEARGRDFLAGAALALAMVKPHLVYLIWPAVGIWAIHRRRWGVVAGGAALLGVLTIVAAWPNPAVFAQFFAMLRDRPPAQYFSPTLGAYLRMAFGSEHFRLQYLPMLGGFVWLIVSWRSWLASGLAWRERVVPVIFASVITTPYGAWTADMVVLLIPVLGTAAAVARDGRAQVVRRSLAGWLAIEVTAQAFGLFHTDGFFIWLAPATLVVSTLIRRAVREPGHLAIIPDSWAGDRACGQSRSRSSGDQSPASAVLLEIPHRPPS